MTISEFVAPSFDLSPPPVGSVNVRLGSAVQGPGGRWVPCATRTPSGTYFSGLFQVGPGQKQLCAHKIPARTVDEAFNKAVDLATFAAA